ncbi:MarR family winged helix-turn-helix transcriptional regulator [Roseomonas chloroacetimidivorans]|uniref:MarR family winged helix-turn-helix transcriptional regulator n=1 Tax=Roseomonas chloroacetimidivorans TaxID=1766656 RepID=UPI003C7180CF
MARTHADRRARLRGMTRAQWVVLVQLERQDGMTQRELADALEVEPITAGRLVDRLEAHGLVERQHDPNDRRCWRLYLTDRAAPVLREITAYRERLHRELTAGLPAATRHQVIEALLQMKANLIATASLPDEAA